MRRWFAILMGLILILAGAASLALTLTTPFTWLDIWSWSGWALWPLAVLGMGLLFMIPPFLTRGRRGLGGFFIPGVLILVNGGILFFANALDRWEIWAYAWPLEVLGLALGFLFAAIYMRNIWLMIPTIIIGANGAVLQFCALTGLWETWAVLWTIEPLSVGLSLLLVSLERHSAGLMLAGAILLTVTGVLIIGMTSIFPGWRLLNLAGPVTLTLAGFLMLIWGFGRRAPVPALDGERS